MDRFSHIHFIGIGGIGMSALARLLLHEGNQVSGSDRTLTDLTAALEREGAQIYAEQVPENITDDIELVVYSAAVKADAPERVEAERRGLTTMNYFEALALVVNRYSLIAISGTHGKTTTTAMLTDIFESAGEDPTAIIGSLRATTKSNFRAGKSKYAIVEACEYQRHFHNLAPEILVITNIEYDHVDYFADLADVQDAFRTFVQKVPEHGAVIANLSDPNIREVVEGLSCTVIDYKEHFDPQLKLMQSGIHNYMNAAAAAATAQYLGIDATTITSALEQFAGTWRRFEYKGVMNLPAQAGGAPVYDDYAHHPTAIRAAIQGAREQYPDKKITAIFQPHTYTRTAELFDDFAAALGTADRAILLPIYAAREENESDVSSAKLAEQIPGATHFDTFDAVVEDVRASATAEDVVLVMGAGDVTKVAAMLTR